MNFVCIRMYCTYNTNLQSQANNRVRKKNKNFLINYYRQLFYVWYVCHLFNYIKRDYCTYFHFTSLEESKEASDLVEDGDWLNIKIFVLLHNFKYDWKSFNSVND